MDPRDVDGKKLVEALRLIGRDVGLRARFVDFLRRLEVDVRHPGSTRDDIIGPVVDALHEDTDVYGVRLVDGTQVRYLYRSKIARDLLLSANERPSHLWEPQTTKLLTYLAARVVGEVVVGGAYFGDHAVLLAKAIAGRGSKVHCFEPNGAQAAMLRSNVALNALANVEVNELGLWHESGALMRLEGFDSFAKSTTITDGEGFRTVSIDDYMASRRCNVGLIQLDIEGGELPALRGAVRTLETDRPIVVFEIHRNYTDWTNGLRKTPICSFLLDRGYQVHAIRDMNSHHEMPRHKIELVELDHAYLEGPPHGFNMLALPAGFGLDDCFFRVMRDVSPKLLPHRDPALHHPREGF